MVGGTKMKSGQQDWKKRFLFRIAKEELVEGVKEVLEIKKLNPNEELYRLTMRVQDIGKDYIVHAIIQLTHPAANEGYWWRLIEFSWEEVKR